MDAQPSSNFRRHKAVRSPPQRGHWAANPTYEKSENPIRSNLLNPLTMFYLGKALTYSASPAMKYNLPAPSSTCRSAMRAK